jgi:Nitrile hydratase, alpha chain
MANQIEKRQDVETQIIARALKDDSFKQQLLSNPDVAKAEIEKALGQSVPANFKVQVLEETANMAYLVLPAVPGGTQGLSEQQLEAVASGATVGISCMFGSLCIATDGVGC